jgi:hypothetical protein
MEHPDMGGYVYCMGNPILYVDPDGRKIKIGRENFLGSLLDVGRIYATNQGRKIINTLAKSNETYRINGTAMKGYSRYNRFNNKITYYQGEENVDGVNNPSYIFLAHELFHAFQDDQAMRYDNNDQKEAAAMQFENYIRDVYGTGKHRVNRGGKRLLNKNNSAMSSYGEKMDINSVKTSTNVDEYSNESQSGENTAVQDK